MLPLAPRHASLRPVGASYLLEMSKVHGAFGALQAILD